jgi:hypothetical protein
LLIADSEQQGRSAQALLSLALGRQTELLIHVAAASHRSKHDRSAKLDKQECNAGAQSVALLSILLATLKRRKEQYMTEPEFLLGRFHAFADLLHREYCQRVREGSLPPQLLGNAMLPTTLTDPRRGIANMSNRLRVYQAWAATRGTGLARWALKELSGISSELHTAGLPQRLGDPERAELLLGYLAKLQNEPLSEGETDAK